MMKCTKCGSPSGRRKFKRLTVKGKMFTTGDIELLTVKVMRAAQSGVPVFKPNVEPPPSIWGIPLVIMVFIIVTCVWTLMP